MTLCMRWIAVCDDCGEQRVLHTMERYEAMNALRVLHWRHLVRDKGQELICSPCADKYDDLVLAQMAARSETVKPQVELLRGRNRPGWMPCPGCGDITQMADAFYLPFEAQHHANLRCLRCCVKHAVMRGYRVDVSRYLPAEGGKAPEEPAQPSLS